MSDLDAIRARHHADHYGPGCIVDGDDWPCDTAIVLAALDACHAEFLRQRDCDHSDCVDREDAALARERRLREAIDAALALPLSPVGSYAARIHAALAETPE